jgi:hypothetical protein
MSSLGVAKADQWFGTVGGTAWEGPKPQVLCHRMKPEMLAVGRWLAVSNIWPVNRGMQQPLNGGTCIYVKIYIYNTYTCMYLYV